MPAQPPARAGQADIVIAGGGPVGLMLASELRLSGTDPIVLERLPGINETPKGNGLVGQIVPMLDYRGLLDRLRQEATFAGPVPRFSFGPLQLDFSRLGTSPVHILTVPQRRLEKALEARLTELGGTVRRGHELTALSPHDDAVTLDVRGPGGDYRLRARYLVGCDGAHSLVRKHAGIGFPGYTSDAIARIARVTIPSDRIARVDDGFDLPGIGHVAAMRPNQRQPAPRPRRRPALHRRHRDPQHRRQQPPSRRHTRAQALLARNDDDGRALREVFSELITNRTTARSLARLLESA
jgi:2-polyprenyl-6-methoxyphenol hydroxylase-like FAD-dependent oxidoreductase